MTSPVAGPRASTHELPLTPWSDFMASWDWRQGEHVSVVGPTGTGKTTLIRALMPKRYAAGGAVVVLATKSRDDNLAAWARHDRLTIVDDWPPRPPRPWRPPRPIVLPDGRELDWRYRIMLWPRPVDVPLNQMDDEQAKVLRDAITDCFWQGGWCIVAEELRELSALGLDRELVKVWTQGRSAGLSLIGGAQRPRHIPLEAYSQASHLFLFGDSDTANLRRLEEIGGMNSQRLAELVRTLPKHDVLYISTRERRVTRTRVPVASRKG